MATDTTRPFRRSIHPVHAVLLASSLPLFFGTLLNEWAYSSTYEVQWKNFASWLNAGALVFAGCALLWAVIDALRADGPRGGGRWLYVGLLAATFVLGFINALVQAKDAWASMPAGLVLSIIVFILALASVWAAYSAPERGETR